MTELVDRPSQRPIMLLLDLLSRRWALRVLWELRDGPKTSRALRAATAISPTVLQNRVNELREAGFIERPSHAGYEMTALGRELSAAFEPLNDFAKRWSAADLGPGGES